MQTKTLCAGIVAALLIAAPLAANAGPRNEARRSLHVAKLYRFDTNRDGKLDQTERKAIRTQFDSNRDGRLDRQERREFKRALRSTR